MFTMQVEDAVKVIVEAVCPVGSEKALYVRIFGHLEHPGTHEKVHTYIHMVFSRKTNYTKVFSCVNGHFHIPFPSDFVMRSDHDYCWRNDGFRDVTQTYFTLANQIKGKLAPIDLNDYSRIDHVAAVNVEIASDPTDEHRYRKLLTKIETTRD